MDSYCIPCPDIISDLEELERKAKRLTSCSTRATIVTGNSIVIFTMLVLQEILEQLAQDPIANLSSILSVANSIAALNSSIQVDP
ncbi:hypothetical protein [Sporomusa aerivorans]|uniref:hypothetical protein n=1 Tax=Sporomusa aerivorans TaxID=204936 RepID=UPI00352BB52D